MLVTILFVFFGLASLAATPHHRIQNHIMKLASITSFSLAAWLFSHGPQQMEGAIGYPLLQEFGVWLSFRLDGLNWAFGFLILFIAGCVFLYSDGYMSAIKAKRRFSSSLFLFSLSMLGLVFSDNFFSFFLFWELTSLTSYLLITLKDKERDSRDSGRVIFFTTFAGGLVLFAAFMWLQQIGVSAGLSLQEASQFSSLGLIDWVNQPQANWILVMMIIGCATKSAQFPFHFWLPAAMTAPTPVSSFLHSATMVKAGIFLLAKIFPYFHGLELWGHILIPLGLFTALISALLCASQTDLKKILAWSTVSVLGLLTMLLGLATDLAIKSFVVFLFAHALYKASLFQVAGNIDKACSTRQVDKLAKLYPFMKLTAIAGLLAALSKAGVPPFFGFIGKELVLKTKLELAALETPLLIIAVVINALLMIMAIVVGIKPFFGSNTTAPQSTKPKALALSLSVSPLILAILGLLIGMLPQLFDRQLGQAMAASMIGHDLVMDLKLWHGLKPHALIALGLSLLTFIIGIIAYIKYPKWQTGYRYVFTKLPELKDWLVDQIDLWGVTFSKASKALYDRSLSIYLIVSILLLCALAILPNGPWQWKLDQHMLLNIQMVSFQEQIFIALTFLIIALASIYTIFVYSFVVAAVVLGIVGTMIAIIFASFGAADLSITQVLAELLIAVLLASFGLRLARLPRLQSDHLWFLRIGSCFIFGVFFYFLASASIPQAVGFAARDYYLASSLTEAFGKNIVNVILVDFRALDTLNEVVVVAMAAIGVVLLLYRKKKEVSGE